MLDISALKEQVDRDFPERAWIVSDFLEWLLKSEDKMIGLYGLKNGITPVKRVVPADNRWSGRYLKRRLARLYLLEKWWRLLGCPLVTMMTLTLSHGSVKSLLGDITIEEAFEILGPAWQKVRKVLQKHCPDVRFVWVIEPTAEGYYPGFPHMHVLLFGNVPEEVREIIKRLWSDKYVLGSYEHGVNFSDKEEIESIRNYIMKYTIKQYLHGIDSATVAVFNAVAWKGKYRLFGMSVELNKWIDSQYEGKDKGTDDDFEVSDGYEHLFTTVTDKQGNHRFVHLQRDKLSIQSYLKRVERFNVAVRDLVISGNWVASDLLYGLDSLVGDVRDSDLPFMRIGRNDPQLGSPGKEMKERRRRDGQICIS